MAELCDASKIDWKKRYKMKKKPRGYGKKVFEERVMAYRRTQDVRKNNN